ncbi:MAG: hypothetical protein H3Z50_05815 [archaeon]|nr:hypothetical protein [archaeon]MCP8306419.1 hypothetical protein [archaeon]
MNIKSSYRIAHTLVLSMMRTSSKTGIQKSFWRRPIIIAIVDILAFSILAMIVFALLSLTGLPKVVDLYFVTTQILIGLPSIILLMIILYGMMWELGQASGLSSSDVVNWLPIKPSEFVLGSAISTIYYLSWLLAGVFGLTFALSLWAGLIWTWTLFVMLSLVTAFIGAFVVEVLRAVMNRVSSTFYKRGGRSAIFGRLVITVLFLVLFMMIFQVNYIYAILEAIASGVTFLWFFPPVWPSLAMINALVANILGSPYNGALSLGYGALSLGFGLTLFWASQRLRAKYWVPAEVSIRVTTSKYAPTTKGFLGRLGFTSIEAALIRKDFKSLTRRREMTMFIALPIFLTIIYAAIPIEEIEILSLMLLLGPIVFAGSLSLASIGAEGDALWNISSKPIQEREITKAKFTFVLLPSLIVLFAVIGLLVVLTQPSISFLISFTIVALCLLVESALVGLAVGSRYPDFRVIPRSRFFRPMGLLIFFFMYGAVAASTIIPSVIYIIFQPQMLILPVVIFITILVTGVICYAAYRFALSGVSAILKEYSI